MVVSRAPTGRIALNRPARGTAAEHLVQLYEEDATLVGALADYVIEALREHHIALVIATPAHRSALATKLSDAGLDVPSIRAKGRFLELDAAETLGRFMQDGLPDPARFEQTIEVVIAEFEADGAGIRAFGEMVALLVADGNPEGALALEEMWNGLQERHPFTLFCAYSVSLLAQDGVLAGICGTHSKVIAAESLNLARDEDRSATASTVYEQKSLWLQAEVAARKRAESALAAALAAEQRARQTAEAALAVRDEFLAIAAHELKTPLTTLRGNVQLLRRRLERGSAGVTDAITALRTADAGGARLSQLVGLLLDTARLETGKLTVEREPIDLASLVREVAEAFGARSERNPVTIAAPGSLILEIDSIRIEQLLCNLLDNAARFSPSGSPIDVTLHLGGPRASRHAEISIRDHGPGIAVEDRPRIFERYFQSTNPTLQRGLGLGLYLARQIVELHGGEISAAFPADGGSRFIVRLPIERTAGSVE